MRHLRFRRHLASQALMASGAGAVVLALGLGKLS